MLFHFCSLMTQKLFLFFNFDPLISPSRSQDMAQNMGQWIAQEIPLKKGPWGFLVIWTPSLTYLDPKMAPKDIYQDLGQGLNKAQKGSKVTAHHRGNPGGRFFGFFDVFSPQMVSWDGFAKNGTLKLNGMRFSYGVKIWGLFWHTSQISPSQALTPPKLAKLWGPHISD